jgi:hypothetical protein
VNAFSAAATSPGVTTGSFMLLSSLRGIAPARRR